MFKSFYYQVINYIQGLNGSIYIMIWLLLFAMIMACVLAFVKANSGSVKQTKILKASMLILAILLFALLIWYTYVRK